MRPMLARLFVAEHIIAALAAAEARDYCEVVSRSTPATSVKTTQAIAQKAPLQSADILAMQRAEEKRQRKAQKRLGEKHRWG